VSSVPLHKQNIQGHIKNIHVLKRKSNLRNIEKELKYLLHKYREWIIENGNGNKN
jgi:hypothetical protein